MSIQFDISTILGHEVTDRVTKLKGVCTGVAEFNYGPPRIAVTPTKLKDGLPHDMLWMDLPRLKIGKVHTKVGLWPQTIKLGAVAKDQMTGFKGIATGRYTYLNGCIRIEITPKELNKGLPVEAAVFDEQRLTGKVSDELSGGPRPGPTPYATCKH